MLAKIIAEMERDLNEIIIDIGKIKDQTDSIPYARMKGQSDILKTYLQLIRDWRRSEEMNLTEIIRESPPEIRTYQTSTPPRINTGVKKNLNSELKKIMEQKK